MRNEVEVRMIFNVRCSCRLVNVKSCLIKLCCMIEVDYTIKC